MTGKNVLRPFHLVDNVAAAEAFVSREVNVQYQDNIGIEVSWSGAASGEIEVLASISGEVFYPLTFVPALAQPSGVAGGYLINLNQLPFNLYKLSWDPADAPEAAVLVVQDLTYTAVEAGPDGNSITIAYIDDGVAGAETVDVTGTDIVVHMDDGVSTALEIEAAINASAAALLLVEVAVTGTGSDAQVAAAETPLAGGDEEPGVINAHITSKGI